MLKLSAVVKVKPEGSGMFKVLPAFTLTTKTVFALFASVTATGLVWVLVMVTLFSVPALVGLMTVLLLIKTFSLSTKLNVVIILLMSTKAPLLGI